jgi:hypothetical protein
MHLPNNTINYYYIIIQFFTTHFVASFVRRGSRGCNPLLAHIKQQPVVDIVNTQHDNHDDRIDDSILILFKVLEKKDKSDERCNHQKKIEDRDTIK